MHKRMLQQGFHFAETNRELKRETPFIYAIRYTQLLTRVMAVTRAM